MPVELPTESEVLLTPPDADEVLLLARGIGTAAAPPGGLTRFQSVLLAALVRAMTHQRIDFNAIEPLSAADFALAIRRRDKPFRTRMVQAALLPALTLRPLPNEVTVQIENLAYELGVDDEQMIAVAKRFASGSLGLAALDFQRNGYTDDWHADDRVELHTSSELASAWETTVHDEELAARWEALEHLPEGTLGRGVWKLYRARGFAFPGTPGSAPPLLAQHDWVHVLGDYGTTVEAELEVFGLIARANDDMHAFSLLAMVVSLFETGYLRTGAGLFEYSIGHLSANDDAAVRLAEAMRRGALSHDNVADSDSVDLLRIDWFALADLPIVEVRERFSLGEKTEEAVAAGSVGPGDPGGISPFQLEAGRALAARLGVEYDSFGASI